MSRDMVRRATMRRCSIKGCNANGLKENVYMYSKSEDFALTACICDECLSSAYSLLEYNALTDAAAGDVLSGKTVYVGGEKITGSIPSLQSTEYTPSVENQVIPSGKYLSGAQTILGDENLLPENIKSGVTIFGVTGTYTGADESEDA